jgi:hypothetical protein
MAQVLALDVAPHGEAEGWRKGEHLVDALAYIDSLDDHDKAVVNALLEEEVEQPTHLLAVPPSASSGDLKSLCWFCSSKTAQSGPRTT